MIKKLLSKKCKEFVIFNLFLLLAVAVNAQNAPKKLFEVRELKADVKVFFSKLEKIHPDLYYYYPKDSILQAKENIMQQIVAPMSWSEFAKLIAINTTRFFDGHTGLKWYFFNWNTIPKSAFLFPPKQISVEKGILYIDENTKIVSINGNSANEMINTMRNFSEAGTHQYKRDCSIEDNFSSFYYHLYGSSEQFRLIVEQNGQKTEKIVQGVAKKDVYANDNNTPNFDLIIKNDIALLTINTFNGNRFEEFKTFLDSSFKQIRQSNISNVFIDVSENSGGGDENVSLLLDYIYPTDYYFLYGYAKVKNKTYGSEWKRHNEVDTPYLGKVYILQSYETFSAAMDFSSAIKASNRGVIIGEMTGDPAYSFSNSTSFTLPKTGIHIACAIGFYAMPSGSHNCNLGILPDVYCHRKELNALKKDTNALFEYFKSIIAKYGDRESDIEMLKKFE